MELKVSEIIDKGPTFGIRHVQFIFIFFLGMLVYSTRFGFSVAIVAMTENYSVNPDVPIYNWHNKSFILSTFFWGYIVLQIPVGIMGTKFGTKLFLLVAVFFNSVSMMMIPLVAAHFGSTGVMVCRIIQGLSQGLVIPCVHGMIGKWIPPNERSRMYGLSSIGYIIGFVIGVGITGFICASWYGWPLSFYLLPALGLVWMVIFYIYGAATPATHPTITIAERTYIEYSLKSQNIMNVPIPYKAILTSVPVWTCLLMAMCNNWIMAIYTIEMPIYMDKVMKFNIKSNGIVSALPSVFSIIATIVATSTADYLISHKYFSVGTTRKIMTTLGSLGCSVLILIFAYLPSSNHTLPVVILILSYCFRTLCLGGYNINHLDLAPNFGSTVMGFINTCGELLSVITPICIQLIVYDETDQHLWRIIFITAACLLTGSTIFYIFNASGEIQEWNFVKEPVEKKLLPKHDVQEKV